MYRDGALYVATSVDPRWFTGATLLAVPEDGGVARALATLPADRALEAFAVDDAVYVAVAPPGAAGGRAIDAVALTGGAPRAVATDLPSRVVALSAHAGTVYALLAGSEAYLADGGRPCDASIVAVPAAGGATSVVVASLCSPTSIAVDDDHVYFATPGTTGQPWATTPPATIERVRLDGSERATVAQTLSTIASVFVDSSDVLWADWGTTGVDCRNGDGALGVVGKDGGAPRELAENAGNLGGVASAGDVLYFAGSVAECNDAPGANRFVGRVDESGAAVATLAERLHGVGFPAVGARAVYFAGSIDGGPAELLSAPK